MWAGSERQRQFIANSNYRRRGSLKESNKCLSNKNFTHKTPDMKKGARKRTKQWTEDCTTEKHDVETTSYIPICLPLKCVKNKLLSSLTFKHKLPRKMRQRQYQQTITWRADLIESPSTERHRNCLSNQVHLKRKTGLNLAMKSTKPTGYNSCNVVCTVLVIYCASNIETHGILMHN